MPSELPTEKQLEALQAELRLKFKEPRLLATALTHQSFLNENPAQKIVSNERLEFLGDAVVNFVVAHRLFALLPSAPEGELTVRRAGIVRKETLARIARRMKLGERLVMGKGEEGSGGGDRESNLADTFEALAGAVLLDRGFRAAQGFVGKWLGPEIKATIGQETPKDPKSRLQELLQAAGMRTPRYRVVVSDGSNGEHRFVVEVVINGEVAATGEGKRKLEAERAAAVIAYERFSEDVTRPVSG